MKLASETIIINSFSAKLSGLNAKKLAGKISIVSAVPSTIPPNRIPRYKFIGQQILNSIINPTKVMQSDAIVS